MTRTPYIKSLETKIEKYLEKNLVIELTDSVQLLQDYIYVEIKIKDVLLIGMQPLWV